MQYDQYILDLVINALKIVGLTSVSAFVSFYVAWIVFPPEIAIEGVVDKSKKLNSESRLKIKNLGKLPAININININNLNFIMSGIRMRNSTITNAPRPISRLANSESVEISITPGVFAEAGGYYSEFDYDIELAYEAKLFFIKKSFRKRWYVELRNIGDEFAWNVSIS